MPSYEEVKTIYEQPGGLQVYLQQSINKLLPLILDKEGSALHQDIIDAIGPERYSNLLKLNPAEEIAKQFIKAIIASFPQRLVDNHPSFEEEIFNSIGTEIHNIANEVTLKGLPKPINREILNKIVIEFKNLQEEAITLGIIIPKTEQITYNLNEALELMDPDNETYMIFTDSVRLSKAKTAYDKAVDNFVDGAVQHLTQNIPEPKEANWLKKILRAITRNEKLFQSSEEKRYDRQMELLPRQLELLSTLDTLNQKLTSPAEDAEQKVEEDNQQQMQEGEDNPRMEPGF